MGGRCTIYFDYNASEAEVITDTKKSRKVNHQFIDDLSKIQRTECTFPQLRNECWPTKSKLSLRTRLRWKNALWKLSKKMEKRVVRKTTYVSKGPDVTLRNTSKKFNNSDNAENDTRISCTLFFNSHHAIVFIPETDDESFSRSFLGVLGRQGICWLAVAVNIDHCNMVNGITCTNWGSRPKSTIFSSWWSTRSSNGLLILHNWKGSMQRHHRKSRNWEGRFLRDACLGEPRASTHNDWWKANWWNKHQQERPRRTWNDEVWE